MIISMPMVGGRDWNGQMVGWGGPVEIDDGDEKATAWAKAWLNMGATLVEDAKPAKAETPKVQPVKAEPPKAEPPKAEPVKVEPAKQEAPKPPVKAPAVSPASPASTQKSTSNR